MKLIEYKDKRFMAKFNRYEPFLQDHTAIQQLLDCDRKYFYRIVLGRAPAKHTYQVVLDFGQALHTFQHQLYLTGDVSVAMKAALAMPLDTPVEQTPSWKYRYLNQERLMRTLALAYQVYEKDKENKSWKVLAAEEPINVELADGIFISGRPDQMIEWNDRLYILDHKVTSKEQKYFDGERDPNDQADRYTYMASKLHGRNVPIIYNVFYNINEPEKPTKGKNYGPSHFRSPIERTPKQHEEFRTNQIQINKQLELNRINDVWPKRVGYQCRFCDYKWVCRQSTEMAQMAKLESDFVLKPWDHENVAQEVLGDN